MAVCLSCFVRLLSFCCLLSILPVLAVLSLPFYVVYNGISVSFRVESYSDWSDFTSCLSDNGVTFDDMYQYLSAYSSFSDYDEKQYNGSIASYYYFCTHIEG